MYDFFEGRVERCEDGRAVLDVGGVGYVLFVSAATAAKLAAASGRSRLLAHLVVIDGEPRLYGFADAPERDLFRLLISVSGVGPATGMALLSAMTAGEIARALALGDEEALRRVKGVGAKTASRLIVELREAASRLGPVDAVPQSARDAVDALESLGFVRGDAERLVADARARAGDASSEELVKRALARGRKR
ncbi:MAG TPA: Holliday junction branch migration protein RuvA [Planctomycetota bacterium]|nr:Holliday junction branch migration protein RuvA [Planctomycetota bacterium]